MVTELTFSFDCPHCHDPFAETKETEVDIHAGAIHRCASCGEQVVFLALTVEQYTHPEELRWDCHFCKPGPCRFGSKTTDEPRKGDET